MKRIKKILQILIPLALGAFLCWYAYSKFTPEQLAELKMQFRQVDYRYVYLSVLMGFTSHVLRGLRWGLALAPLGYFPKKRNMIMAVFVGYLLNLTIPRSGEVSRAVVLSRYDKVPFHKGFATIITERLVDFVILISFVLVALASQFSLLWGFLAERLPLAKILLMLALAALFLGGFSLWLKKTSSGWALRLKVLFSEVKQAFASVWVLKQKGLYLGYTAGIWLLYFLMFYVVFFSVPAMPSLSVFDVLTAFVVGSFAITFTNGGFGSYPFFIAEILTLFGVAYTTGTTLGWVMWVAQFLMILVAGGGSFFLLGLLNPKPQK